MKKTLLAMGLVTALSCALAAVTFAENARNQKRHRELWNGTNSDIGTRECLSTCIRERGPNGNGGGDRDQTQDRARDGSCQE